MRLWLVSMLMVWLSAGVASAQPAVTKGRRMALLVGVNTYDRREIGELEYAIRDVEEFREELKQAGFDEIRMLTSAKGKDNTGKLPANEPTAANVRRALEEMLGLREGAGQETARVTRDDLLVVGMAGHGIQPLGSAESYFLPVDANIAVKLNDAGTVETPEYPETLLGLTQMLKTIGKSNVGRHLVLIDACRERPRGARGVRNIGEIPPTAVPLGGAVLMSCSPGQIAREHKDFDGGHGAFFCAVLRGLRGEAVNRRGQITWDSLHEHVADQTRTLVEETIGGGAKQETNLVANAVGGVVLFRKEDLIRLNRLEGTPTLNPKSRPQSPTSPSDPPARPVAGLEGKKAGDERSDNGLGMKLVWCPAGTFTMGSPKSEKDRMENEDQVEVALTQGFWLGKYEVTQGEWERVMGTTPWKGKQYVKEGPRYAASYISWAAAIEFVKKLTDQERQARRLPTGWEYTLPTEAQWEYACRADKKTAFSFGDTATQLSDYAWWGGLVGNGNAEKEQYAHEVGGKKPNAWGLHDLHGNVWELCVDGYTDKLPGGRDPLTVQASDRVFRGGGWINLPSDCRSASRYETLPVSSSHYVGFRVARSPVR